MNVSVVAHQPAWRQRFESEAAIVCAALGSAVAAIHHIGSTAIPGIYSKPIIDMLVEATSIEAVDDLAPRLVAEKYEAKGEFGLPGRRYFRKNNSEGIRQFQIHAYTVGSGQAGRHLAFRDYLRSHPDVAEEYSQLKRELAGLYPSDIEAYMDGKDPFIKAIEQTALAWWPSAK